MEPTLEQTQWQDYRAMLNTRHQAAQLGITAMEPWPIDRAARLMAIVQVFGNNEGFTLSPKFRIDREYIQKLYGIDGGEQPDSCFASHLREWVSDFEAVKAENDPLFVEAEKWIKKMYDFQLYV